LLIWLIIISRILISQDREEIYVTLAEYKENYINYLKNRVDVENKGFLVMTTYGSFVTENSNHMAWLGGILRVLLPYAATYQPPRELSPPRVPRTPSPVVSLPPAVTPPGANPGKAGKQREQGYGSKSKREPSPLDGKIPKSVGNSTSSDGGVSLPESVGKIGLPIRTSASKERGGDPSLRPRMSLGSLKDIQYPKAASEPAEQSTAQHHRQQERGRDTKKGKQKKK
jgi:hypothetical protein